MTTVGFGFDAGGAVSDTGRFGLEMRLRMEAQVGRAEGIIAEANTAAMRSTMADFRASLKADIAGSGMANAVRLSNIWRATTYPTAGASLDPGGYIKAGAGPVGSASRGAAAQLIDAFTLGVTITAKGGKFLAIPVGPAKALVRRMNQAKNRTRVDGKFADEAGTVARVAAALGVPRLVAHFDRGLKVGVLVAPGKNLNDRGRKLRKAADTVCFVLVRSATLKKRLRGRALLAELEASFPATFEAAAFRELAERTTS